MVIRERIQKMEGRVETRMNELGLRLRDVEFLDWTPMWLDMLFDLESVGKAPGFEGPIPPEIFALLKKPVDKT